MRLIMRLGLLALLGTMAQAGECQNSQQPWSKAPGSTYSPDSVQANELQLGLGFSASYDDNTFNTPQGQPQTLLSVLPSVQWDITRPRWISDLSYKGQFSRSTTFDFYNRTSNNVGASFDYQFSPRLWFAARETFVQSADPFFSASGLQKAPTGVQNPSYLGTPAVRTNNIVDAEAHYGLDAHSNVTIGGTYYTQQFSDTPQAEFRNSNSVDGRAEYQRNVSAQLALGASYDFTKITTPGGFFTVSQRVMLNGDYTFRPSMKLSVFAGPNYVTNNFILLQNQALTVVNQSSWTWSAGATYMWSAPKLNMIASAIHQVSDGGGIVGAVQLTDLQYRLDGQLSRHFSGSLYAGFSLNDRFILQGGGISKAKYGYAGASLERAFLRDFNVRLSYDRMEELLGIYVGNPWLDRNRVTISINYLFTHPLGR